ncbi:PhoU family transcriptional regulator [Mycoplasmopsis caviae]|uniref:PhoU family transcriptional regulator n=1 Tax=Mycoplasmopsis caviae TaxID=55603 RepID=A0A3P8LHW1_9BACT|nr:PhoU domain-containing protein [Mycoplasmopsis caviae]UUD35471.1 PhoU family transcriptional regulator [Mycoplasmopsis caviae]VDR41752.1 Phosphate transport system protein PhoU [Mycoplasmopsis caviae]
MAINYTLLKKSEENLRKMFFDYLDQAYKMHTKLTNLISMYQNKADISGLFLDIEKREKQSDLTQVNTIDELLWDISKDQPLLSHLRWYICVLTSASDIERICDYLFHMSKFFYINKKIPQEVVDVALSMNIELSKIFKEYSNRLQDEKSTKEFFVEFKKQKEEYMAFCDNEIKKIAKKLSKKDEYSYEMIIKFSFELHSYYRVVERLENIIENLIFIHDTDFFRKKLDDEEMF